MGYAPLPLGYSYAVRQGFLHAKAPPMAYVYPGTQMGMPPAEYEAAIRNLAPEASAWGPSQINAIFTYLSNNAPIRTDEERTDPASFACTYDAALKVSKERVVYFLAPDGPADNPANWKKACQVYGWSEANGQWTFPQASKTDITIWYQAGAGEKYDYSIAIGDWFGANWKMIAATVAVVASIVVTVLTLGGASATIVGAAGLVGACASAAPKLADGYEKGNYSEILSAVSEIGKAGAALTKSVADEIAKKDPKFAAWATNVAASVSKVYDQAKAAGGSIADLSNAGMKLAGNLPALLPQAAAMTRETIGPVGQIFWDAAANVPLKDLPNYAAENIPWYAQGAIELQATIRAIDEAQTARLLARAAQQQSRGNVLLATHGVTPAATIAAVAPIIRRTVSPARMTLSQPMNKPKMNGPGNKTSSSSTAAIMLAALAAVGAWFVVKRK